MNEESEIAYWRGRNDAWIEIRDYAKNRLYEAKKVASKEK